MRPTIAPYGDNVLVALRDKRATTASGLHIPDTAKRKYMLADVLRVGPGNKHGDTSELREGDVVMVDFDCGQDVVPGENIKQEYTGMPLGFEMRMVRVDEIWGIVDAGVDLL